MSTRTTSARPASAIRWAVVAPTLPAPMTVTLLRAMRSRAPFVVKRDSRRGPYRPPNGRTSDERAGPGRRWRSALAGAGHLELRAVEGRHAGAGGADRLRHAVGVGGEVLHEHPGEGVRLAIVGRLVRPGRPWLEDGIRDIRARRRDLDAEDRVGHGWDVVQGTRQR